MSDSWQDRDFSFGYMESENKKKAPKSSKRFHRSIYGHKSGQYVREQSLFSPLFCLILGISLIGLGIFAVITMQGDARAGVAMTGFCVGGFCNSLGVMSLLAYFNVIDSPFIIGSGDTDISSDDDDMHY